MREAPTEMLIVSRDEWIAIVLFLTATLHGSYSALDDVKTWGTVLRDLGFDAKIVERVYHNRPYVIVTGRAGLRELLRGRWYRADNVSIVRLALGTAGRMKNAFKGTVITIALVCVHDVLEAVLSDEAALKELLPYTLTVDISKVGIASIVGLIVGAIAAAASAPAWIVVGGAILVGVWVGMKLDNLLPTNEFAVKLEQLIESTLSKAGELLNQFERDITRMVMSQSPLLIAR